MTGLFVTGTDTGIGKTLVSAWLATHWRADYWKPVQSGIADGTDSGCVEHLVPGIVIHPSTYVLNSPLSPHCSARRDGLRLELSAFHLPVTPRPLVVEGAGGVMVPLNESALMIDLIERLGLPVLIVARSGLGTINHTLMTLEMLRRRPVTLLGVILNGPPNPANREAIIQYGRVPVVAELPPLPVVSAAALAGLPPPDFLSCPPEDLL